jgi:transposase-like protein
MFKNGSKFMSLEIILPDTQNVIPYGKSVLVMHGTIEYNKEGEQINRSSTDGEEFAQAVQKVGADKQKTFGIEGPKVIAFSDAESLKYAKLAKEYNSNLNDIAKQYGLNSKSKLEDYRNKWWQRKIDSENKESNLNLSPKEKKGLVNRWANGDKTFGVKSFDDNTKSDWFRNFETNELQQSQKEMIKPIENIFLNAGAQTLKRVSNFLSTNSPTAAKELKRDTLTAIKAIRDSKDPDKIAKLQKELERLDSIGLDNLVPSEGVVFMYNGNPYKYTGTFAPINQIQGTFKFDKPAKKEDKVEKNEIAIFSGRFQPFHAGHYSIYKSLVDKFGKDNVYISSSNIIDPVKSPFPFKDKKAIMNKMFGIPTNKIIQVKNPYSPVEILSKYPEDTKYVTAVSEKDAERLEQGGKYFKNYDKVPDNKKKGYEDEGYYIIAPEMQLKVNGKNISGTQLRATFGNDLLTTKEKKDIFNQVYPKFDKDVFANIVVTTKKAEAARKSKETTKKGDLKSKIKSLDPKTKKRVDKVLQTKIKNPDTGNTILVKSALKYDDTMRVKKQAVTLVKQAMKG